MITITTVLKTSNRYTTHWIDIMKNSLDRHMTIDYQFEPMSDRHHPYKNHDFVQDNPGFWNKIELFRPGVFSTPVLFLDLDTVITGDLAPIIAACAGQDFLMYRGGADKKTGLRHPSSPVMYWEQCPHHLWDVWNSQPKEYWFKKYAGGSFGDQAFIRDHTDFKLIQDLMPIDSNYFCSNKKNYTPDTRLIVMGGPSKKPDVVDWDVVKQNWRL